VKVGLDAGHGGKDVGHTFKRYREKDITLAVVRQLEILMKAEKQHEPVLTRMFDHDVLLEDRLRRTDAENCDVVLSIHLHADPNDNSPEGSGTEVWVDPRSEGHRALGKALYESLARTFVGYPIKGVRYSEQLDILKHSAVPAALVELGFIDLRHEAEFLSRPAVQRQIALALHAALDAYAGHP